MERRSLVSKIILGTVQFGVSYGITNKTGGIVDDTGLAVILDYAKDIGINKLDTARDYGNAIERIGNYQSSNNQFKIISKFKKLTLDSELENTVSQDLRVLNSDCFDSFLFHSFEDIANKELVADVIKLKEKKLVRKIGVSIYDNNELIKAIDSEFIELIQLPFNLLDNVNQRGELIRSAKKRGKEIHIRSAFLQGLFFMNIDRLPPKLIPLEPYIAKLQELARDMNVSLAEMAIMYPLLHECIDGVLVGVDNVNQLKENIRAVRNSELDKRFLEKVNRINIPVQLTHLLNPVNWK